MPKNIKSWMKYGCTCDSCMEAKLHGYDVAYARYRDDHELIVSFSEWETDEDYGTTLYVNGLVCGEVFGDPESAVARVLEFLQIPSVVCSTSADNEYLH